MKIFYLIIILLMLTSCKNDMIKKSVGQYRGTTSIRKAGFVRQALVSAEVKLQSRSEIEILVRGADGADDTNLTFIRIMSDRKPKEVSFLFPTWGDIRIPLKKESKTCFVSKSSEVYSVTLCFNGVDLTIDLEKSAMSQTSATHDAFTLAVSRTTGTDQPVFEIPQIYTLAQLFQRSMDQNFDSPIQFEKVVQAKLKMQTAYLNLAPHFAIIGVLNFAAGNLLNILKAVGDLVPFLLPTRWMEMKAAKYQRESEFDAWILTKANSANVVEGLALCVLRDNLIVQTIEDNRRSILQVRDQMRLGENAGLVQAGTSDDIQSIINLLDRSTEALKDTLIQEKMALSEASGFNNFAAIQDVQSFEEIPVEHRRHYSDLEIIQLSNTALDRSYERRQLNALIGASRIGEKERYFQWLDPSGDYRGGLGINLVPYVRIGISQTQELIGKRHKMEAELMNKVGRTAVFANQALGEYALARKGLDIQNRRIQRQFNNLQSGINFSMIDLSNAVQEKLKTEIEILRNQYAYYIANSNLNRVLLAGPYADLPTERGELPWIIPGGALN